MSAGLYFSAHWCPPCRGFTPELAKFYNEMKKKVGDKLEIVFISSDRSEADWKGYFAEMPWLALPFSARDIKVGSLLPDSGAEYCDNVSCVCLSVRERISRITSCLHVRPSPIFLHITYGHRSARLWRRTIRYVLPVLWMTSLVDTALGLCISTVVSTITARESPIRVLLLRNRQN